MKRKLMVKKIEVDPGRAAAALSATQNASIKAPRRVKIGDIEGKVEKAFHRASLAGAVPLARVSHRCTATRTASERSHRLIRLCLACY
jgi:hypothetical protein